MQDDICSWLPSVIYQLLMSKAHGKTTTFSTNFDFMNTAQKNFEFIVTKQGNFYIILHAVR